MNTEFIGHLRLNSQIAEYRVNIKSTIKKDYNKDDDNNNSA